ncbi:MAG: phosphomethylpyrimidine synthase ThiC [Promethearchaeota archaeon]|nr:MAG: phosphomethylpyrimidine synthase ThiC [Candidatus Lokiarchaeota archaeon]
MLQMKEAKAGRTTPEMEYVAKKEQVSVDIIRKGIANGRIVIFKSTTSNANPLGIGEGLSVKINSNIGASQKVYDIQQEIKKAEISVQYGADTVMDLTSGPTEQGIRDVRKAVLGHIEVPLGTVPMYQIALRSIEKSGGIINMTEDDMFSVVEEQAKEGVDFFTIHAGVTKNLAEYIKKNPRYMGIVSRGGTITAVWTLENDQENPFYANYDYLLEMAQNYDFSLSLGDGFRPGCIFDSTDYPQVQELLTLSRLVKRAQEKNIQVICEGPGHVPAHQIAENMRLQKSLTNGAPFYVLGPLVTDIAPGYDHIVGAIGGVIAGMNGVDYLCYVTPSEHLGLPNLDEVKEGVIAFKIAAHAIDLTRNWEVASQWDRKMDRARKDLDWNEQIKIAIDPEKARRIRERDGPIERNEPCTMCGSLCAIKILEDSIKKDDEKELSE